jgi:hypothetical protein
MIKYKYFIGGIYGIFWRTHPNKPYAEIIDASNEKGKWRVTNLTKNNLSKYNMEISEENLKKRYPHLPLNGPYKRESEITNWI